MQACHKCWTEPGGLFVWYSSGRHLIFAEVKCNFVARYFAPSDSVVSLSIFHISCAAFTFRACSTFLVNENVLGDVKAVLKFLSSAFEVKIILAFLEIVLQLSDEFV